MASLAPAGALRCDEPQPCPLLPQRLPLVPERMCITCASHSSYSPAHSPLFYALLTALSSCPSPPRRLPKGFEGFSFTGKIRPGHVTPMMKVPAHIPKPDYADAGLPLSEIAERGSNVIPLHTPEQLAAIREACAIGRQVLDLAAAALRPGVTGEEIDKLVFAATVERGGYPSPLNYHAFPKSLCMCVHLPPRHRCRGSTPVGVKAGLKCFPLPLSHTHTPAPTPTHNVLCRLAAL
jgi:hypothetical protein